jgi:hypothetical protein
LPVILSFPNPSRSLDANGQRLCFWGYDRAMEISFFLDIAALRKLCPEMGNVESGIMKAFDEVRDRIHEAANEAYAGSRTRVHAFTLSVEHF